MTFKIGDLVRAKHPMSPRMTIEYIVDERASYHTGLDMGIHVFWFDSESLLHREVFHPELLETAGNSH